MFTTTPPSTILILPYLALSLSHLLFLLSLFSPQSHHCLISFNS
uniref:Uncharacterized protein n=1 Tax=Manihot esculenta TaxID=3983 RepID=A0A2C9UM46_MANES